MRIGYPAGSRFLPLLAIVISVIVLTACASLRPSAPPTPTPIPTVAPTATVVPTPSPALALAATPTSVPLAINPTPTVTVTSIEQILQETIASIARIKTNEGEGTAFSIAQRDATTLFVTNAHVVQGATQVIVLTQDGQTNHGVVIARDENVDLAIVSIAKRAAAPPLLFGDPNGLKVGNQLYVIGFGLGLELDGDPSVTRGILSARRPINGINFVQTDAAINPGNSGGPVIDSTGKVVGVAARTYTPDGGQGIGLALPADLVQTNVTRLLAAPLETSTDSREHWTVLPLTNAPGSRTLHVTAWTGSEMIVWGGWSSNVYLRSGARFDPAKNAWHAISHKDTPSARASASGLWTGRELLVWGGYGQNSSSQTVTDNDGARYNPKTDTWSPMPLGPLAARGSAGAVWTGTDAIIWGGTTGSQDDLKCLGDGARFNPSTSAWSSMTAKGAPSSRRGFNVVWTGHEMIVWGGQSCDPLKPGYLNDGARYNPQSDSWTSMSRIGAPTGRTLAAMVWSGRELLVWGGYWAMGELGDGARYNPGTDMWLPLPNTGAPSARFAPSAVWTGSHMIVWGGGRLGGYDAKAGKAIPNYFSDGAQFDPSANVWLSLETSDGPRARELNSAAWTGTELIVWGGYGDEIGSQKHRQVYLDTGSRYHPAT